MRIIVDEGQKQQDAEISKIKAIIGPINKSLMQFKIDTGYDDITMQEIISLAFGANDDRVYQITEKLNASLDKQISSLNLSTLVTGNLKKGADVFVKKLASDLNKVARTPGSEHIHNLSLELGQLILPRETEAEIRESFRSVITTEPGKKLLDLQTAAAKSIQELFYYINDQTVIHYTMPHQMVIQCFDFDPINKKVEPILLDYDRITNKAQKVSGMYN